jgi:4-diphosphocytidyl-2-C-methyl-D-erythritol kinase
VSDLIRAHAKLTVHLHMTGIRDDGYHLIDAEMVSLDLHDELRFTPGDELVVGGPYAEGVPLDERNIVNRALRLAGRSARVELTKNIPHGGGLGGGSADAAAAFRWAGFTDLVAASTVGADVPFCIVGGRARVHGIGELVEPLPFEERTYTLLAPPFGVDTAAVYRAFDEQADQGSRLDERNHLANAAIAVEPRLRVWSDRFRDWTGVEPVLAGSGATWFVEGAHESPGDEALEGARWFVCSTV